MVAPGLRVERTGANAIRVYATDSSNPPSGQYTSSTNLLRLTSPTEIPIMWYYHSELSNKITGSFTTATTVYFTVEVERRPAFAEATMISAVTANPIPGTVFELQRRNPTNTDWNPVVGAQTGIADAEGVVRFELTHGWRYRIREVSVPAPYIINDTWRELTAGPNQTMQRQFQVNPAQGYIKILKQQLTTTTFNIFAAEDIVQSDGTVIYLAGTLVDIVEFYNIKQAQTRYLPLGVYNVREVGTENSYRVEIVFENQTTSITRTTITVGENITAYPGDSDPLENPENENYDDDEIKKSAGQIRQLRQSVIRTLPKTGVQTSSITNFAGIFLITSGILTKTITKYKKESTDIK